MGEEKEQLIREAINNGISSRSIYDTLYNMYGESDLSRYTKRQIELVIRSICDMKISAISNLNLKYSSDLVRNNYDKIIAALNDGINPEEVANKLVKSIEDKNISIDDFNYLVNLIAGLKKKDLKYMKSDNRIYQKTID